MSDATKIGTFPLYQPIHITEITTQITEIDKLIYIPKELHIRSIHRFF